MYVYLALLLGISILIVWVYKRYWSSIEHFATGPGQGQSLYPTLATKWNDLDKTGLNLPINGFAILPSNYTIFPITITQKYFKITDINLHSYDDPFDITDLRYDQYTTKGNPDESTNTSIIKMKLNSNGIPRFIFKTTNTATRSHYKDGDECWTMGGWCHDWDSQVQLRYSEDTTEVGTDRINFILTDKLLNSSNGVLKDYRPATQNEIAWLLMNNPMSSYVLNGAGTPQITDSPIMFIVGPTPNHTESLTTNWKQFSERRNLFTDNYYKYDKDGTELPYGRSGILGDRTPFTLGYDIKIVGPINTQATIASDSTSVSTIDTDITNRAILDDTDYSINISNKYTSTDIKAVYDTQPEYIKNILKKYIFYGTKTYSRGCNTATCKPTMQRLQNTYTAYDLQIITDCAGCLNSDFTDISGLWTPRLRPLLVFPPTTDKLNEIILKPTQNPGMCTTIQTFSGGRMGQRTECSENLNMNVDSFIPKRLDTTNPNTYNLYVYRTDTNNGNKEELISTQASVRTDNDASAFTVAANSVLSQFKLDLNTNTITANTATTAIKSFTIPASFVLYKYYMSDTTLLNPKYTFAVYKKPDYGWGTVGQIGVTDASGKIFESSYELNMNNYTYTLARNVYTYTGTFPTNVSLPAGTYNFILTSLITNPIYPPSTTATTTTITKTVSISPTASFTSYILNLSGAGSVRIGSLSVPIGKAFCSQYDGSLSVGISHSSSGFTLPMTAVTVPPLSYTSTTTGLNFDVTFANSYELAVSGTDTFGYAFSANYDDITVFNNEVTRTRKGVADNTGYTNKSGITGFRVVLNSDTGKSSFYYYDNSKNVKTDVTDLTIPLLYPTSYKGERKLVVDVKTNNNIGMSSEYIVPTTELTLTENNLTTGGKGAGGQFLMGGNTSVVLPAGTYNVTLRSYTVTGTTINQNTIINHLSSSSSSNQVLENYKPITFTNTYLSSYSIDTVAQKIIFYGKATSSNTNGPQIGELSLENNFNTTITQTARSIDVSITSASLGTFETIPLQLGGIHLTGSAAVTDNGYIISGAIKQNGNDVSLGNSLYTIAFNDNQTTTQNNTTVTNAVNLFTLRSNELAGAKNYELNITKDTITFTGGTEPIVLEFKTETTTTTNPGQRFIERISGSANVSLDIVINGTIKSSSTVTLPLAARKFTITQSSSEPALYTYTLPEPYVLIPSASSDYVLTLREVNTSGLRDVGKDYGVITFKPSARTREFKINVNTGKLEFTGTTNVFDVQGLRDAGQKTLEVTIRANGVDFPATGSTKSVSVPATQFKPVNRSGSDTNLGVYSGSDESTNVRVDFGAQTGSLSGSAPTPGSITPVSQLEPDTNYTITVNRTGTGNDDGILFQSAFTTSASTSNIAAVNYNRDDNKITFVNAAGNAQTLGNKNVFTNTFASPVNPIRINGEKIKITITQGVNYATKELSGSQRTFTSTASAITKPIFTQSDDGTSLGVQKITTSWDSGYVQFTLTNTINRVSKTVQLKSGIEYAIQINGSAYRFKSSKNIRKLRLNIFTGKLEGIYVDNETFNIEDNTGLLATTTPLTISASIKLVTGSGSNASIGADLYEKGNDLTVPKFYIDCSDDETAATTDVFVLLGGDGKGFTRAEAASKSISGLQYATIDDLKVAAKGGANWDTPGWILGARTTNDEALNAPPVYPVNEYSEIQIYSVPHREYFASGAPGPIPKGPYVISYLPSDNRAGILVKGDRKVAKDAGFTVVNFNTYTGRPSLGEEALSREIFHIALPANTSWTNARAACQKFGGDIAIDTTVGAEGLNVPIGAQWPMYGFIYKLFVNNDSSNLVRIGHPTQPTTANKTGIFVLEGNYTTASTANGVICYGSKRNMDRGNNELKFDTSGNPISSNTNIVSDYNYDRHIWSKYESVSPLAYESYMPKNIDAIAAEPNAYYKAAMIINDGRAQPNIVFSRNIQDAELYAGCDVRYMTCIAKSSDDEAIERKYVAPTSSTGKWVNVDLEEARLETPTEGFQDQPLPAYGMARMMSDMELFGRTPVALEGLVGGVGELGVEDRPQIPLREPFVDGKVGVDDATRQAVNEILDCQAVGGAVNITMDKSVYPGCDTICCFPDDGRKLDPSLIKNRRKTSGPGAATCDDEGGCTETTSKRPIRHTPPQAAYQLKKKTGGPSAAAPATKCASATPLRTQVANAKRDKLEALRNKPVN